MTFLLMKMKILLFGLSALGLLAGCGRSNVAANALVEMPGATTQTNMTIEKITKPMPSGRSNSRQSNTALPASMAPSERSRPILE
jgi:hypothetical protein